MEEELLDEVIENEFIVQPYMYEPMPVANQQADQSETDTDSDDEPIDFEALPTNAERFGHTDWCDCTHCSAMDTQNDVLRCCREYGELNEELESAICITETRGFMGNCLTPEVLEVDFTKYLKTHGPIGDEEPIHEIYRYIAYRRLAIWIWRGLRKYDRRVLPTCAVNAIRRRYPSENYTGFKYADREL